jgi:hypothetical protein
MQQEQLQLHQTIPQVQQSRHQHCVSATALAITHTTTGATGIELQQDYQQV